MVVDTIKKRRCGYRKPGKAYFVVERQIFDDLKVPVMYFIQDPPEPVHSGMVSAQGITVLPRVVGFNIETMVPEYAVDSNGGTIYDVYDYVGGDYPNVVDFVEEAMDDGISRLTPKTSDYAHIGIDSEYRLVHPRAVLLSPADYFGRRCDTGRDRCPKYISNHISPSKDWLMYFCETCAGLWWEDMIEHDGIVSKNHKRLVMRKKADGSYFRAALPPAGVSNDAVAGIFMRIPIGKIGRWDVVRSDEDEHLEAIDRLKALKGGLFRRTMVTEV